MLDLTREIVFWTTIVAGNLVLIAACAWLSVWALGKTVGAIRSWGTLYRWVFSAEVRAKAGQLEALRAKQRGELHKHMEEE